jgi:hypothetical protein
MDKNKIVTLVNRSPELVDLHDREGWLNLFSTSAVVEDPVGAGMNRKGKDMRKGKDGLGRFYDIFIAPNSIRFTVHQDILIGNELVRDVSIQTVLPNGAVTVVGAYLIYRVIDEGGQPKIENLRAHWDFTGNAMALLKKNGFKGTTAAAAQFATMIKIQGMKRVIEYCGAMYKGIRGKGTKAVAAFADALNAKDEAALMKLCDENAVIEFPAGKKVSPKDFFKFAVKDLQIAISGTRSGGWYSSCIFAITGGGSNSKGVAFFQFNPKTKKICSARFFWN